MGRSRKGRDSIAATFQEDDSALVKAFRDYTSNEAIGVLNAIEETMEELEIKRQAMDFNSAEAEDETFEAASEQPGNFPTTAQEGNHEGGPLLTAEEVAHALRREETGRSQKEGQNPAAHLVSRKGLRARFQRSKKQKKKEEQEQEDVVGIFGTTTKPPKWSLSYYLQSVASTREKRVVAVSAWILALVGLIISLVFVTKDFIDSRQEMASTVRYIEDDKLEMPSLWLCTMDTALPHFVELPSKEYPGQPLFWIDFFRGSNSLANVTYPQTKELPQLETGAVNILGQRCGDREVMSPEVFENENMVAPSCFQCFRISRNPAIVFDKESEVKRNEEMDDGYSKHATFRVSRHSFPSKCRTSQYGLSRDAFSFFKQQIKEYHVDLKERGILDFGVFDPKDNFNDQYLWPLYRMGYANATVDFAVYDVVDMFCNVYMFSGYYYPSSAKQVKFRFNDRFYRWERAGNGPFYPQIFNTYYAGRSSGQGLFTLTNNIGGEKYENRSMYASQAVQILTNHSRNGGAERIAALEPHNMASLRFSRNMIQERESFDTNVFRTTVEPGDVRAVNYVYYLDISFENFMTRAVSDQLRVSWPAFIADFFGLTSLFLDVSVYTLIVSPLIMRARKKALLARKMDRQGATVV